MSKRENIVVSLDEIQEQQEYIKELALKTKQRFKERKPLAHIETWGCQMG